jgi:pimeloyl-ACP methyl ester carboxylesterase
MPTAMIDGIEVSYVTRGTGPALLMLAPGGFDATMEKWTTAGVWKGMRPLDTLTSQFTVIAYDRRESGDSGGRVERLSWSLFADQAKGLLDHLKIREAYVLGGCMGCSVALAFAARYPETTRGLILHWPVGGYRWKINGSDRFARHARFAKDSGLAAWSSARTPASRSGRIRRRGRGRRCSSATPGSRTPSRSRIPNGTPVSWPRAVGPSSTATCRREPSRRR